MSKGAVVGEIRVRPKEALPGGGFSRRQGRVLKLHLLSQEIFPAICLLFPWSLTYLKILKPRPPDVGQSWACQGSELRQVRWP